MSDISKTSSYAITFTRSKSCHFSFSLSEKLGCTILIIIFFFFCSQSASSAWVVFTVGHYGKENVRLLLQFLFDFHPTFRSFVCLWKVWTQSGMCKSVFGCKLAETCASELTAIVSGYFLPIWQWYLSFCWLNCHWLKD